MTISRCFDVPLLAATAALAAPAAGQSCQPHWSDEFGSAELGGSLPWVFDLAVFDDGSGPALYAGGTFHDLDGGAVNRIARLGDGRWLPLAEGVSGSVFALQVFDDGSGPALYAGGLFQHAGAIPAAGVARWDGRSWQALGAGIGGVWVEALAVFNDGSGPALYAGGYFSSAGGVAANNIARWDGSSWSPLGSGLDGSVMALVAFDDGTGPALYAGGFFDIAGGVAASSIARWDGSSWSPVGVGAACTCNDCTTGCCCSGGPVVNALVVHDDGGGPALYAGGAFATIGDVAAANIARWDGVAWSPVGGGIGGAVQELAVFDGGIGPALYAGHPASGSVSVLSVWDGKAWTPVGQIDGNLRALAGFEADCIAGPVLYAGGNFYQGDEIVDVEVAKWNGTRWSPVSGGLDGGASNPPNGTAQAFAIFDDGSAAGPTLYVGGGFRSIGGEPASGVARRDGACWQPLGEGLTSGDLGGPVRALEVFDDGNGTALFAGGGFTEAGGSPAVYVARWDGRTWSPLGTGLGLNVLALAVFDDGTGPALYAAGYNSNPNRIARWDGRSWSPLGTGVDDSAVTMAVFDDGSGPALYVGGYFETAGGHPAEGIARWDGSAWSAVGDLSGYVFDLALFDDGSGPALYATGGFSKANLARWDGSAWTTVGGGITAGFGTALAVVDDGRPDAPALYVGGTFTMVGGVAAANIARWNGTRWSALGAGLDLVDGAGYQTQVRAMIGFDDGSGPAIFAGGSFNQAGTVDSEGIARWDVCPASAAADLDGDGVVGQSDFAALLEAWGPCPTQCPPSCSADLDGDCAVGVVDFLLLLMNWTA